MRIKYATREVDNVLFVDTEEGPRVAVAFDPDTQQWSVFVNTEDAEVNSVDGTPEIQVCLNDATLYDVEPGKRGG